MIHLIALSHKDEYCTKAFKCVHCGGSHASYSKKCTVFKKEYDIQSIRVSSNISFFEARMIDKKISWTEGSELCWSRQSSDPAHTNLNSRRAMDWGSACYTDAKSCAFVTSRPVSSVSRSVGTTTLVAVVKNCGSSQFITSEKEPKIKQTFFTKVTGFTCS